MVWKLVQLIGMMLLLAGVTLELYTRQDVIFYIISIGSLVFALGTKFVHYKETKVVPRGTNEKIKIKGEIHAGF